jgi:penicillin-binding protein 1A
LARSPAVTLFAAVATIVVVISSTVVLTASAIGRQVPHVDLGTDNLPPLERASVRPTSTPTTVFAADGSTLGQFVPEQQFVPIDAAHIPKPVADVVTASEDPDFYNHHGFTITGTARAALVNASAGDAVEGGSTITQQVAKNLYTDGAHTFARKVRELAIAVKLEDHYSKDEILAAYLNTSYFGEGALGIRAAASVYFNKPVDQLTLSEIALLTGLIPAPSERDPRSNPAAAEAARQHVLDRVAATNRIDAATINAARTQPPQLAAPPQATSTQPFFMEYVRQWLLDVAHIPPEQVFGGGLRVETSLDPTIQAAAAYAVAYELPDPNGPTAAAVVLDHRTGHVLALIGGRDWASSHVDLARGADGGGTGRQPGSSFKPFVLADAIGAGFRPDDPIPAPANITVDGGDGADASIQNFDHAGYGTVSLTDATVHSINTAYTWLTEQVGPQSVRDLASAAGIGHLPPTGIGPSIGLGAYETSPMDMAAAYSMFPEDGHRVTPVPVVRVTTPDGRVIVDNTAPAPGPTVVDPAVCRTVTGVLGQVIDRGTGTAAKLDRPAAGKTGTTDDYANAWFVGYTPQLTAAVWVGYPAANIPMHDVNGVSDVVGGTIPARIWHDLMTAASANLPSEPFPPPLPLPPGTYSAPPPAASPAPPPPAAPGNAPPSADHRNKKPPNG